MDILETYLSIYNKENLQEGIGGGMLRAGVKFGQGGTSLNKVGATIMTDKGTFGADVTRDQTKDTDQAAKAAVTNALANAQNKERDAAVASRSVPSATSAAKLSIKPNAKGASALGGGLSLSSSDKSRIDANRAPVPTAAAKVSEPQLKTAYSVIPQVNVNNVSKGGAAPTASRPVGKPVGSDRPVKSDEPNKSVEKPNKVRKAKALGELGEEYIDEAEGSYGQTPNARQKMGDLANKRRHKPASEYSERGEKTTKVKSAEKHYNRMGNPDAGNRGKKSTKPSFHSGARKGMTQSDRDHARGEAEYGHVGYDPDWNGPASGPGGKPKGKKLERQKKTGVSAESFDLYDIILSHLLDEGYASTEESADKIILNMSESWFEEILEARASEKKGLGSPEVSLSFPGRAVQKQRGEMGGRHWKSGGQGGSETERGRKKSDPYSQQNRLRNLSNYPETPGKYAKMQSKKRDLGSRYD